MARLATKKSSATKLGKGGRTKGRQSKVRFPYYDLAAAVEMTEVIHQKGGGVCDKAQLAALMGYKKNSGSFAHRVATTKMFGLVDQQSDYRFRITPRGKAIVAPVTPKRSAEAKVDAFLSVELFERLYEDLGGSPLPDDVGLQNLIRDDYGVIDTRAAPTVRIMLASAEYAGLFATAGKERMVIPPGLPDNDGNYLPDPPLDGGRKRDDGSGNNNGGGGGDSPTDSIDPAIAGLLRRLPPGGTPLTAKRREQLVTAFTHVVAFVYPDPEDGEE